MLEEAEADATRASMARAPQAEHSGCLTHVNAKRCKQNKPASKQALVAHRTVDLFFDSVLRAALSSRNRVLELILKQKKDDRATVVRLDHIPALRHHEAHSLGP